MMSLPNETRSGEISKAIPLVSVTSPNTENETTPFVVEHISARPEIWPTQPKPLISRKPVEAAMDVYDGLLCAIAVALMVKTTLCIVAHRQEKIHGGDFNIDLTTSLTLFLVRINEQLVTAFTIIFVTILSTFVKRLALFKAQKGARITDLEQLQASISLPSTIKIIVSLRKFGRVSIVLLFAWSFYYVGSQASQREYTYVSTDPFRDLAAVYPSDKGTSDFDDGNVLPANLRFYATDYYMAYYASTGDSNVFQRGVDEAGNALIPDAQDSLEPYGPYKIGDWLDTQAVYAGFWVGWAGLPITYEYPPGSRGWSQKDFRGHYTLNTSYLDIECENVKLRTAKDYPKGATRSVSLNMTARENASLASEVRRFEVWTKWNASDWFDSSSGRPSINGSKIAVASMLCNITRPKVELLIKCSQISCPVKKMRFLPMDDATLHRTPFDDNRWASTFFHTLLSMDPLPDPADPAPRVTSIDWYIGLGKALTHMAMDGIETFPTIDPPDDPIYSVPNILSSGHFDLTQTFNTWYIISKGNWTYPSFSPNDDIEGTTGRDPPFEYVKAYGADWHPHYALSWPWIVADYASCAILLAAAIYSFWLRKHTLAPDILGYVSSLTRDNPHLALPEGGSALSGIERARHMKNVRIKIGDVDGGSSYGRVGIVHAMHEDVTGLRKDRKYL